MSDDVPKVPITFWMKSMDDRLRAVEATGQETRDIVARLEGRFEERAAPAPVLSVVPPEPPEPHGFEADDNDTTWARKLAGWWADNVKPVHVLIGLGLIIGGAATVSQVVSAGERYLNQNPTTTAAVVESVVP